MELAVQQRNTFGKQVKALRAQGLIPAELYGRGVENLHLVVPSRNFHKVYKEAGESMMINVVVEDKKIPVMIQEVGRDPVTDEVRHVDFYQVRLDEKISVAVPLVFTGEAPAVKTGGVLVKAMHEIEVEALPHQIPHSISVDVSSLHEIGSSIYVNNLVVPEGVEVEPEGTTVVATITEKAKEEEEAPVAAEVDLSAIKTEGEEKKAEKEKKAAEEGAE